ncbi:MAG: hypothetical protein ACOYIK_11245, partial [Coriobacteriales bacterium]
MQTSDEARCRTGSKFARIFFSLVLVISLAPTFPSSALADDQQSADSTTMAEGEAWDGTFDYSWYNTTDTSFTITTPEQLAGLARIVNGYASGIDQDNFTGKTITLGADIILNSQTYSEQNSSARAWTPIGDVNTSSGSDSSMYFNGTFDGNGHVIKNIYIDGSVSNPGAYGGYQGLFGAIGSDAVIENVGIDGGYIYGRVAGGIAAISHTDSPSSMPHIIGCFNTANIAGNGSTSRGAGGIFGGEDRNGDHTASEADAYRAACYIANCYNTGTINGSTSGPAGGIAGTGSNMIYSCYNVGTINSSSSYAGSIVGNVYATGSIPAGDFDACGVVVDSYALSGTHTTCYNLIGEGQDKSAATAVTDYFKTESQLKESGAAALFSQSFVDVSDGYPQLYWQAGDSQIDISTANATVSEIDTQLYTGSAIEPEFTVTVPDSDSSSSEEITLKEGSDY